MTTNHGIPLNGNDLLMDPAFDLVILLRKLKLCGESDLLAWCPPGDIPNQIPLTNNEETT